MNSIIKQSEAQIPTKFGDFSLMAFSQSSEDNMPIMVLASQHWQEQKVVNVRLHSECMTGDVFHSLRCDCGEQLDFAMQYIAKHEGLIIYLRQEGRGIGIIHKLESYNLQDQGLDTAEANEALGYAVDSRSYESAMLILHALGVQHINLLTNNPKKVEAFNGSNITIEDRIGIAIKAVKQNQKYLKTKKEVMGHWLK